MRNFVTWQDGNHSQWPQSTNQVQVHCASEASLAQLLLGWFLTKSMSRDRHDTRQHGKLLEMFQPWNFTNSVVKRTKWSHRVHQMRLWWKWTCAQTRRVASRSNGVAIVNLCRSKQKWFLDEQRPRTEEEFCSVGCCTVISAHHAICTSCAAQIILLRSLHTCSWKSDRVKQLPTYDEEEETKKERENEFTSTARFRVHNEIDACFDASFRTETFLVIHSKNVRRARRICWRVWFSHYHVNQRGVMSESWSEKFATDMTVAKTIVALVLLSWKMHHSLFPNPSGNCEKEEMKSLVSWFCRRVSCKATWLLWRSLKRWIQDRAVERLLPSPLWCHNFKGSRILEAFLFSVPADPDIWNSFAAFKTNSTMAPKDDNYDAEGNVKRQIPNDQILEDAGKVHLGTPDKTLRLLATYQNHWLLTFLSTSFLQTRLKLGARVWSLTSRGRLEPTGSRKWRTLIRRQLAFPFSCLSRLLLPLWPLVRSTARTWRTALVQSSAS